MDGKIQVMCVLQILVFNERLQLCLLANGSWTGWAVLGIAGSPIWFIQKSKSCWHWLKCVVVTVYYMYILEWTSVVDLFFTCIVIRSHLPAHFMPNLVEWHITNSSPRFNCYFGKLAPFIVTSVHTAIGQPWLPFRRSHPMCGENRTSWAAASVVMLHWWPFGVWVLVDIDADGIDILWCLCLLLVDADTSMLEERERGKGTNWCWSKQTLLPKSCQWSNDWQTGRMWYPGVKKYIVCTMVRGWSSHPHCLIVDVHLLYIINEGQVWPYDSMTVWQSPGTGKELHTSIV